jgi:cytochrome c peroxidase
MFWDGRADSLEQQALEPITNPLELGSDIPSTLERLRKVDAYVAEFRQAFSDDADGSLDLADAQPAEVITPDRLARALAAFERTLIAGNSSADQFHSGAYEAISAEARRGMWLFESRGRCWKCHNGDNLSDEAFHNTGVGFGTPGRDEGRFEVTKDAADRFRFKTPSLRGVALTPPYFHDGSAATLEDVVRFYNRGGHREDPLLDEAMLPLELSDDEVAALAEFLRALTPLAENPR